MRAKKAQPPANEKVIDATAGPPSRPVPGLALEELQGEQHGRADSAVYDLHSFTDRVSPHYARLEDARLGGRLAWSRNRELDDYELADDNLRAATTSFVKAAEERARLEAEQAAEEAAAKQARAAVEADGDGHRLAERRSVTLAWVVGAVVGAFAIEVPWSYFAMQVLGEGTAATASMAVLYGALGVVIAELIGIGLKRLRRGSMRRSHVVLVGLGAIGLLSVLGTFLASLRTAYLAAPITLGTTSSPSALQQFHLGRGLVFAGWLAANLGLWSAIATIAYLHYSPWLGRLQRALAATRRLAYELGAARSAEVDAGEALVRARQRLAHVPERWAAYRAELWFGAQTNIFAWQDGLAHAAENPELTTALEAHRFETTLGLGPESGEPAGDPTGASASIAEFPLDGPETEEAPGEEQDPASDGGEAKSA